MKHLILTLFLILGLATSANADVFKWICNQERGSEYQFLLSFDSTTSEVTRKGETWPVSQQGIYVIWHEADYSAGDVSASINVFDPSTSLLHYKALHFEKGGYLGESGTAIKCGWIQ